MHLQQRKCPELYEKYRIQSQIGRGASGVCYRVVNNRTKEHFALKKIHINSIKVTFNQIRNKIQKKHVPKYRFQVNWTTQTSSNYFSFLVMKAICTSSCSMPPKAIYIVQFWKEVDSKKEENKERYLQLKLDLGNVQTIAYFFGLSTHTSNHTQRCEDTQHLLGQPGEAIRNCEVIQLGDLGVSKILKSDNGLYSRVGTPLYLAPQIIKYEKYDYKADIWGLGCVCYQLATFNHPFQGKNIISLGQNILGSQPKQIQNYSPQLNNFILDMLEKNPSKRLGAEQLLKKYFKQGTRSELKIQTNSIELSQKIGEQRSSHLLKSNMIRRKKLLFNQSDKIKDEKQPKNVIFKYSPTKKQIEYKMAELNDKNQEDTLIITKKIKSNEENKKFVEATYKSCLAIHPIVSSNEIKNTDEPSQPKQKYCIKTQQQFIYLSSQKQSQNTHKHTEKQFGFHKYVSDKKIIPTMINNKSLARTYYPILDDFIQCPQTSNKRIDTSYTDVNRLLSQNYLSVLNKKSARVRPKSSIMTKQRHESTMKNIKKSYKRGKIQSMDRFVQTQVLKRPQMIML